MTEALDLESESNLDEFGIAKMYRSSKRIDAPKPFIMGIGNWQQRLKQWDGFRIDGLYLRLILDMIQIISINILAFSKIVYSF